MTRHPLFWLPNVLTLLRCIMSIFVAVVIYSVARQEVIFSSQSMEAAQIVHHGVTESYRQKWAFIGFLVFALAAFTDWLDGVLARAWNAESRFGRLLDPIADKLIIGLPLLTLAWASNWALPIALPVLVIVIRDGLITLLRFAGLGASAMAVSYIAKLKTFLEMVLLALLLAGMAMFDTISPLNMLLMTGWVIGLWLTALLSAWTGISYLLRLGASAK